MTETLVFIPGFANNALAFHHQISDLENEYDVRVYVMDKFSSRQEMVEHLLKEIPERFILVGHSMGGWVAQAAAAKAPNRISKLILLNTWADFGLELMLMQKQICEALKLGKIMEVMHQHLPMLIHPSRYNDMPLIGQLQAMIGSFSIDSLIRQLEAMLQDSSSTKLHAFIKAPTLIIHSRQDALFPMDHEALSSGIQNSSVAIIEESGHASTVEKPEVVTKLIRSFIER